MDRLRFRLRVTVLVLLIPAAAHTLLTGGLGQSEESILTIICFVPFFAAMLLMTVLEALHWIGIARWAGDKVAELGVGRIVMVGAAVVAIAMICGFLIISSIE